MPNFDPFGQTEKERRGVEKLDIFLNVINVWSHIKIVNFAADKTIFIRDITCLKDTHRGKAS